jgi:oligopeptide/dipeptide ABC transporter ATP-binding protein
MLDIRDLSVEFSADEGVLTAVDHVSFEVGVGEVLGLIGESGCGKSVTALSIMRLLPKPAGRVSAGRILFKGCDLLTLPLAEMRKIRGAAVSMIFQEPMTALSPLHRIGRQLTECVQIHRDIGARAAEEEALSWLMRVGIPDPGSRLRCYPHELSGGMRQRVMIAMALMLHPALVIADEPTTALDVTVQAQILDLMRRMRERTTSILLITHDMGVIRAMCDRVAVMYAGHIVESGMVDDIFSNPLHPYTRALLNSVPSLNGPRIMLPAIPGQVPSPLHFPAGCRFNPRCSLADDRCRCTSPVFTLSNGTHGVACLRPGDGEVRS